MTIIFGCRHIIDRTRKFNRNFHVAISSAFCSKTERGYVTKKLDEGYKPHIVEKDKYKNWEKDERFVFKHSQSDLAKDDKVFSMVLPPPNITGNLHLGHALTTTLQDIIARWKRMSGYKVLFLPGTDHAGIATQVVIEKYLSKKGIDRRVVNLEGILEHAWEWKQQHGNNIRRQLKRLGASLDWSREVFTMDEKHTEAVQYAILELNKQGYIYRGHRLVNWSCALKSTISDFEVESLLINGPKFINIPGYNKPIEFGYLTKINYKLCDSDDKIVVATTRPETILGDTAIAVHPDDERYKEFHYKHVKHPLIERILPIIPDSSVDPNFGTGALKITPAHDKTDYEIALKHDIDVISVIDNGGCIIGDFKYFGMPRYKARVEILKDLENIGALVDHSAHSLTLPICSRTGDVIELIPQHQWFLQCEEMSEDLKDSTDRGDLKIIPQHHKIVWYNRLESQMDWCLSRQLWWGHKLPFWWTHPVTRPEEGMWITSTNKQEATKLAMETFQKKQNELVCRQDSDVLDTWFSAGLYPFTSLGWPNKESNDYKHLYPLSLMVTGYDIMCLWVMRMAMLGKLLTGSLPFPKVLLHGIVTDAEGSKMSKSKGNVINPEDVINGASLQELNDRSIKLFELGTLTEKELKTALGGHKKYFPQGIPECGADALRFTLCEVNPKNQLITFNIQKCFTNKLFGNKMWQSVKYFTNCYETPQVCEVLDRCSINQLQKIDAWLLSRLYNLVHIVNKSLENYDFHLAVDALKKFLYEEMCDIYIECTKQAMKSDLNDERNALKLAVHCHVFAVCFNTAFRCLTPFMPYLMEELIPAVPRVKNMIHNYSDTIENLSFPNETDFQIWCNVDLEKEIELSMSIISVIRQLRHTFNINYKIHPKVFIDIDKQQIELFDKIIKEFANLILFITKCEDISVMDDDCKPAIDVWSFHQKDNFKIHLELPNSDEMIEKIKEAKIVLLKKREKLLKTLTKLENLVNDKKFIKSASDLMKQDHLSRIEEIKNDIQNIDQFQTVG